MKEKCWHGEDNLISCSHLDKFAQALRLAKGCKLSYGLCASVRLGKNAPCNL